MKFKKTEELCNASRRRIWSGAKSQGEPRHGYGKVDTLYYNAKGILTQSMH